MRRARASLGKAQADYQHNAARQQKNPLGYITGQHSVGGVRRIVPAGIGLSNCIVIEDGLGVSTLVGGVLTIEERNTSSGEELPAAQLPATRAKLAAAQGRTLRLATGTDYEPPFKQIFEESGVLEH